MLAAKRPRLYSESPNKLDTSVCETCNEPVHSGNEVFKCVYGANQYNTGHAFR